LPPLDKIQAAYQLQQEAMKSSAAFSGFSMKPFIGSTYSSLFWTATKPD